MVWLQLALALATVAILGSVALALRETNKNRRAAILIIGSSIALAILIAGSSLALATAIAAGPIPGVTEP